LAQGATKDVVSCDKLGELQTSCDPRISDGATPSVARPMIARKREANPGLKHLSTRRKRKQPRSRKCGREIGPRSAKFQARWLVHRGHTAVATTTEAVWAGPISRSLAYFRDRGCFLFLRVLRCFSSPGLPRACARSSSCDRWGAPFGDPGITAVFAAPPGLSQLTTSFVASLCQGIHRAPLHALIS